VDLRFARQVVVNPETKPMVAANVKPIVPARAKPARKKR
jgi:hypothetical protein